MLSSQYVPRVNIFAFGTQVYAAPGCPAVTGGPSGVPCLFAAETLELSPIHMVPVFVDRAVIVQPVACVGGDVTRSCTGVPAVVTVVEPSPPGKAQTVRRMNKARSRMIIIVDEK